MTCGITLNKIGIVHSQFICPENMPIQPSGEKASEGKIEVDYEYMEGLKDLNGFSHIILIYYFHKSEQVKLTVTPFLDNNTHGIFATRSPVRPNHIGLSVVEIDKIIDNTIYVKKIDVLDGTPVLDIKPFVPKFDVPETKVRIGWLTNNIQEVSVKLSDYRFSTTD